MPKINKKIVKKTKAQTRTKTTLVKSPSPKRRIKDPVAYFNCMKECCQAGIRPKKITEIAHECKTNALVATKKFSTKKLKDLKKLGSSFNKFQKDLGEYIKKH